MQIKNIYIAALLHDIGKLIERSKIYDNKIINETFSDIRYSHARYTGFFLKTYLKSINWIKEKEKENLLQNAMYHHQPKDFNGKIIQLADWLASSERVENKENTAQYNTVQLRSIFGTLNNEKIMEYYDLKKLSFSNLIPDKKDEERTRTSYHNLSEEMLNEFKRVKNKEDLFFLLEKYFSFVPAQTTGNDPDISLFDHSKLTAAIAVCLEKEANQNKIDENSLDQILKKINKEKLNDEYFILLNADLSGIQNYIFNIPSKGAAKSLKGRSTYIVLLMEAICDYMIRELDLENANIIYNGGGNFYILAPASFEERITDLRKEINRILLDAHQGKLFCNIGYTRIRLSEFKDFKDVWKRVGEETVKIKQKKLSEIWEENYENLFEPKELITDDKFCSVCHSQKDVKERDELENLRLCSLCYSFKDFTEEISKAKYGIRIESNNEIEKSDYKSILKRFNFNIHFKENVPSNENTFVLNEFGNEHTLKWKLGAFNLPIDNNRNIKTFEELAGKNGKLAYLKLDVDNLGKLFIEGFKKDKEKEDEEKPSLSRMSVLSRMLRIFFEGFLPYFIKNLKLENNIYLVFSGGDDTFLIGDVDTILNFSLKFRKKFREFCCENPTITFSAGIGIFRYNFPIVKATQITGQYLEEAKSLVYPDEAEATKDKVTILGEVFGWNEFSYILDLFEMIKSIVDEHSSQSRGIIQKIINSTKGFQPLLDSAQKGKLNSQKIWRLQYFLRTAAKDTKEKIIKVYEKMWMDNLYIDEENREYEIKNHQIITVAAKLADLQTRK